MGDFEDVFGAGADAAEIIDGYAESYNRSNWKDKVSWWGKPSDEEYEAASQWDEDDAWMASMKAKGYVRGPHFDSYQELNEWDRQNTRPHIRRPTYYGYDVFFTDGQPYIAPSSDRNSVGDSKPSEYDDEMPF
ncbi:hypothetical protein AVO45_03145 [Ruegeria marisrubri]|uniref:Uncharacterized protein n=1 Tax=Ruegeria marisrubri TaxID=1685379 RepID=A0A101CYZ7_9RHOB|nr:hypothetical protein [Ruegeria marisrubri]KUJ85982.1 hypothetical protein AVO45_03145 [Ruegeria marisrubri]